MSGTDEEAVITWRRVTCEERDDVYNAGIDGWGVGSSLTDLDGLYGEPQMFTEWWDKATERPVLRDRRYPSREFGRADLRPCEHFVADALGCDLTLTAQDGQR